MKITPELWRKHYQGCRLLLDGADVTNRCVAFDAAEGWAELYIHDSDNNCVIVRDADGSKHIAQELRRGVLSIVN